MRKHKRLVVSAIGGVLAVFFVILLCVQFVRTTQQTMYQECKTYLSEIAGQLSKGLEEECQKNWNAMDTLQQCSYFYAYDVEDVFLKQQKKTWQAAHIYLFTDTGTCFDEAGSQQDIPLKQDKLAEGQRSVFPFTDAQGNDMILFFKQVEPYIWRGNRVEAIGISYTAESMKERLQITTFDNTENLYVLRTDGTLVFHAMHANGIEGEQPLAALQQQDPENIPLQRLSLTDTQGGMLELTQQGIQKYLCYTKTGVSDWFLLFTVPVEVANQQLQTQLEAIAKMGIALIIVTICIAACIFMLVYHWTKERNQMALEIEQQANEAKVQFLANMSHDIRTPISAVMGMAQIAMQNTGDSHKLNKCLQKIMSSSRHLLVLVNDVLDMSKISNGKMTLHPEPFRLPELLEEVTAMMQAQAEEKGQKFEVITQHIQHEHLCADTLRLNQICINILSNAIKFTPEGGRIALYIEELPSEKEGYARFEMQFRDTGIGIGQAYQAHIFECFSREQNTHVAHIQGTGLGMAIVKNIVDMMNGTIAVESRQGMGTMFTVCLDLQVAAAAMEPWEEKPLGPIRVMVADGNAVAVQDIMAALRQMGAVGYGVYNGVRAAAQFTELQDVTEEFDVVLLSIQLPLMDGRQTARAIHRARPGIPIFLMGDTAQSFVQTEGVSGVLIKPIYASTLYEALYPVVFGVKNIKAHKPSATLKGVSILLAEDHAVNREVEVDVLQSLGARIDCAEDGQRVVERFMASKQGQYHLILMNIQMPNMDGLEATKKIRDSGRADANVPIIALTANAFEEDRQRAFAAGITGYMTKPIDFEALAKQILQLQ